MSRSSKIGIGGRPNQAEAAQLSDKILDAAKVLFFDQGYGRTSIDQIAAAAHVAKRTLYSRFDGKKGIFEAVIKRHIDNHLLDIESLDFGKLELEDKLRQLAIVLHGHILNRDAIEMDRAITAEATHFPGLASLYRQHGAPRYIEFVSSLLTSSSFYSGSEEKAKRDARTYLLLLVLPFLRTALFCTAEAVQAELDNGILEERLQFFLKGIGD